MTDVRKAVQWRSCPKGHLYLGRECPCQHPARYRASIQEAPSEGSPVTLHHRGVRGEGR